MEVWIITWVLRNNSDWIITCVLHCYVEYKASVEKRIYNKDYRYCVKSVQFLVKHVAGCITILVINYENLLAY